MTQHTMKLAVLLTMFAGVLSLTACAKKTAKITPPPPPAPAAPTATLAANPAAIQQGQASVLTWQTNNAREISIAGLGTLPPSGTRSVMPGASTTYTLTAQGAGGATEASARVTVSAPLAKATSSPTDEDLFRSSVKDVFFDYDKYAIRPDEAPKVQNDEAFLSQHPSIKVLVEGHCDDRGSEEYNIALGTSRAESVRRALVQNGVPPDRVRTVSYGKEKPFCTQENEQCWQQNRVDHFTFDR